MSERRESSHEGLELTYKISEPLETQTQSEVLFSLEDLTLVRNYKNSPNTS